MGTSAHGTDYLAIIPIGGGSSWGRSPDKEKAIENAITALRDWEVHFDVSGIDVTVNVVDVAGYSTVSWSRHNGFHGTNEVTGKDETFDRPIEHVIRITPKWKRRRK